MTFPDGDPILFPAAPLPRKPAVRSPDPSTSSAATPPTAAADWTRLKDLLAAALSLEAGRRAAFVEESCKDDLALKSNLQELLAAHEEAGDFLESSTQVGRVAADVLGGEPRGPALAAVSPPGARRTRWQWVAALLALAVAGGALVVRARSLPGESSTGAASIRSLAVLPLADAAGAEGEEYLSDGLTEGLIAEMARIPGLRVISRASVVAFRDVRQSRPEIAGRLGVDALVDGSLRRSGAQVQVVLRLLRGSTGETLWTATYDRPLREAAELEHDAAGALATELALAASPRGDRARAHPQSVEAYEAYLRGRYYWNLRTTEAAPKAIDQFNQALALDPLYAQAYAGLADTYLMMGDLLYVMSPRDAFARAEAAALRAVDLDPSRAEPYATLGHLRMHAWQWPAAEQAFQRAIALNPGYASAHQWRAYNLASLGRMTEAVEAIERAQQLDPLSLIINADHAQVLYFAGRDAEAVAQCGKTLQMGAYFAEALRVRFLARLREGRREEARADLEAYRRLPDGGPGGSVGYAYAVLGRRKEALAVLDELKKQSPRVIPAYDFAAVYAGLGEADEAFRWLDKALSNQDPESMILPVDPRLDRLRADPRFRSLLVRMGVPAR